MSDAKKPPRQKPVQVLVVSHGDAHLEAYALPDAAVEVKVVNVPFCPGHEAMAEDVLELLLPPRWRKLYFPGHIRATGSARPMLPSSLVEARRMAVALASLNAIGEKGRR